jgi:hypothetical protein
MRAGLETWRRARDYLPMRRALVLLVLVPVVAVTLGRAGSAHACGGGLVTTRVGGSTAVDAQRIYLSIGETSTQVVTEIRVPAAMEDFGVLLPLPAMPTLDPEPVPSVEMDQLTRATDPALEVLSTFDSGDQGGCGCVPGGAKSAGPATRGAQVGPPVTIGPVTAVVLDASSAAAVQAWLADSGFTIPAGSEALVASHSGPGRTFIALRRATAAAPPASSVRVGVHFTLPGDQRALPLRFARLGADAMVSFTVFVAARTGVATALPFETFALAAVDANLWRGQGYDAALAAAVSQRGNHAFAVERRASVATLTTAGALGPRLSALTPPNHTITRLSTRVPAPALDSDAEFSVQADGVVDNLVLATGLVRDQGGGAGGGPWPLALLVIMMALVWRGWRRRTARLAEQARVALAS